MTATLTPPHTNGAPSHAGVAPCLLLISGWNLYNIGDVAITPGFLRLVKRSMPEARVTILAASYPNELRSFLQTHAADLPPFEVLRFGKGTSLRSAEAATRHPAEATAESAFAPGKPLSAEMEAAFAGADALVLNSGMTLSYGYYGHEWERIMSRMLAFMKARELGVPYGVYGHSFDRIDPHADVLYRDVFRTASFLYTRDSESLGVLRSRGVACPEMAFGPDSTFAFDLRDSARGDAFLRRHRLESRKFLAFVPRLDVSRFRSDGQEQVHAQQARDLIARWVRATGEPVVIVPEVERLLNLHRTLIFDQLPADVRPSVRYADEYWMPDEAQHVYAHARLVVSAEMHSVILGLAAGTPSLHPYFTQAGLKQWMMRDIGLPEWLFDQDAVPLDVIADAMLDVWRNYESALGRTEAAMRRVRQRQDETMAVVREAALAHATARRVVAR